jgi:hypothetical protein
VGDAAWEGKGHKVELTARQRPSALDGMGAGIGDVLRL